MDKMNKAKDAYEQFSSWIEKYEDKLDNEMIRDLSKIVRLLEELGEIDLTIKVN